MSISNQSAREAALADGGPLMPDGDISASDRQVLLGHYPLGVYDNSCSGVNGLAAYFPTMVFKDFEGDARGLSGNGYFNFKVLDKEKDGKTLVMLYDVVFNTENKADITYRNMIGVNQSPEYDDEESVEYDGTEVV